jgi:hypothetical protein
MAPVTGKAVLNENFLITGSRRVTRVTGKRGLHAAYFGVSGVLLAMLVTVDSHGAVWVGVAAGIVLILMGFGFTAAQHRLEERRLVREHRKSQNLSEPIEWTFSEEGVGVTVPTGNSQRQWPGFTKARLFRDGLLLLTSPRSGNWIPRSAFASEADFRSATELARTKVRDFKRLG